MQILLTEKELALFENLPETELVDLAIELDIAVGEVIERAQLLSQAIAALAQRASDQGLPFSQYDLDDLAQLDPGHRRALARHIGAPDDPAAMIKAGRKVFKRYRRDAPNSQVPLLLPMLLPALARHVAGDEG